jgi:hypothetical protein
VNDQIPPELLAATEEAIKEHQKEKRRSLEIRTSFYEKLSAINAASIAVAASIGIAMIAKPELQSPPLQANAHWLVGITVLLWASLVCAVIHNFAAVRIAELESTYSSYKMIKTIIHKGFTTVTATVNVTTPAEQSQIVQAENLIIEEYNLLQGKQARRIRFSQLCATTLGYISIASFLIAYTLVMARVVRLW